MLLLLLACHLSMTRVPLFAFETFYFFLLATSRPRMGRGFESRSATEPPGGGGVFKSNSAAKTQGSWLVKLPIDYSFV